MIPKIVEHLRTHWDCWGDPSRVHLGDGTNVNNALFNTASGEIFIGNDTFFGHNVCILTGTHDVTKRRVARHAHPISGRDVHIGTGVWIASNATVLGPCRIGDDAVVAAGSVLLPGEYEGGKVYAGVPARAVKDIEFSRNEGLCDPHPSRGVHSMWCIMTWHGTRLTVGDGDDGPSLGHEPTPEEGRLMMLDADFVREISGLRPEEEHMISSGPLRGYAVRMVGAGIAFRRNGKFLCAEPGAPTLMCDRDVCGPWETFRLVDETGAAIDVTPPVENVFQVLIIDGGGLPADIPENLRRNIASVRGLYPTARHHLLSGDDARQFLADHFPTDVGQAYDALAPFAFKADLVRYCLLLKHGGLYSDIGNLFLNRLPIPAGKRFVYFRDLNHGVPWGVQNSLLFAKPGARELQDTVDAIVAHWRNREYGPHPLSITGPLLLGRTCAIVGDHQGHHCGECRFLTPGMQSTNYGFIAPNGTIVALSNKGPTGNRILGMPGTNNYIDLWNNRQVYRDS